MTRVREVSTHRLMIRLTAAVVTRDTFRHSVDFLPFSRTRKPACGPSLSSLGYRVVPDVDRLLAGRQSLAEALRAHGVVPVLGPEMVTVENVATDGECTHLPFYRVVVDQLLATYGSTLPAATGSSGWLLHRGVAQVLADHSDVSTERVRRSVSAIVKDAASGITASPLLDRLARLRVFDLYICLTPDDLLVDALQRLLGADAVKVGAYSPNADSSQPVDVSPACAGTTRVFFPLGRSATGTRLAIHEEDALEYFYKFQEEGTRRAPNLLTEMRSRDLLFLGCNLPDWLGRGFLRLANEARLSSQDKKMEFFAADAQDPGLNSFLARFNPNATVFPWSPSEFVAELEALLGPAPRHAVPAVAKPGAAAGASPSVFVSYASEDRAAARRVADALVELKFGDVWFDQRKLIAGDDWSDRIDDAIEHCDFFVPVLSKQADRRREGVFWEEWRKAVMRAMRVNDAFVLPIGIDATAPDRSGYERIFNGFTSDFRRIQLMHAPQGQLSDEDIRKLQELVGRFHKAGNG